jgi:hypothetical protein
VSETYAYYTRPSHVQSIHSDRLTNKDVYAHIERQVESLWSTHGFSLPVLPDLYNSAILARQLATARFEDLLFREMAKAIGYTPTWWPFECDIFTDRSPLKRSYLHPHMCVKRDRVGLRTRRKRLADFTRWEGKRLDEIETKEGANLVEWHKRRHREIVGPFPVQNIPKLPYQLFLSLFVIHGVLFEDYHGGESGNSLGNFTTHVFEPAFKEVIQHIGLPPLIVRLPWWPALQFHAPTDWESCEVVRPSYVKTLVSDDLQTCER